MTINIILTLDFEFGMLNYLLNLILLRYQDDTPGIHQKTKKDFGDIKTMENETFLAISDLPCSCFHQFNCLWMAFGINKEFGSFGLPVI